MATPERSLEQSEDPTPDIPLDDPATLPPDEGDAGETAQPAGDAPHPSTSSDAAEQADTLLKALNATQLAQERKAAVQAAVVALNHRAAVHYTQGSRRWDGIKRGLLGARGQFPSYADCSSFVTWCLWNGMRLHNVPDIVNGQGWHSGYTGTLLRHGHHVSSEAAVLPGDLVFYGSGWPGKHVAICIGGGRIISHGSEAGPFKLLLHYRRDFMEIRRYIGSPAPGPGPGPGPGPRGVKQQQQAVNGLGYKPRLVVDGIRGPKTIAGIKWLQKLVGTTPDGEWGPDTERKYVAYIKAHPPRA
jgi:cell wall-associated NlpC family hydrolase